MYVHTYEYAQPHTKRTVTTPPPRVSLFYLFIYLLFYYYLFFPVRVIYDRTWYRDRSFFFIWFFIYPFAHTRYSATPKHTSSRVRDTILGLLRKTNFAFFFCGGLKRKNLSFVFLIFIERFLSISFCVTPQRPAPS